MRATTLRTSSALRLVRISAPQKLIREVTVTSSISYYRFMSRAKSTQTAPDGRRDRWQAHREARRGELIAAVIAVVSEHGPGVGMDDIAAASGIAKPVFYRYFSDKSDLFLAVGRAVAESVVAETTAAIDQARSPRAKLEAGIGAYVASVEANP